jgi:hypothetical protein
VFFGDLALEEFGFLRMSYRFLDERLLHERRYQMLQQPWETVCHEDGEVDEFG